MGKRRHDESEENQGADTPASEGAKQRKDTKKRKNAEGAVVKEDPQNNTVSDAAPANGVKKSKRKKDKDLSAGHAVATASEDVGHKAAKRSKKNGKHSEDSVKTDSVKLDEGIEADAAQSSPPEKPKKKKKSKHKAASDGRPDNFPDPSEDEGLSERARTGLIYAYLHKIRPKDWKFNKAQQNWIVKHLWSAEAIPPKYFVLAEEYLRGSNGAVRTNIIESCKNMLSTSANDPAPTEATEEEAARAAQLARSRQLLAVLGDDES